MRFSFKKRRKYLVLASVAIGFSLLIHLIGQDINRVTAASYTSPPSQRQTHLVSSWKSTEEPGRECLPEGASNAQFIGQYQGSHSLFTIWDFTDIDGELVLRINSLFSSEICGLAFDSRYDEVFSDELSEDVSRQLYLVFHRKRIEQVGGLESYQVYFDEQNREFQQTGEPSYLAAESMWALNQLGIDIPEPAYQIYDPDNPPVPQGPPTGN